MTTKPRVRFAPSPTGLPIPGVRDRIQQFAQFVGV
jgi:hypothetical protein